MSKRKHWSFYDLATGRFTGCQAGGTSEWVQANTPLGQGAIEGSFNAERQRFDIETGEVIYWRADPPPADEMTDWVWSDAVGWMATPTKAAKAKAVRMQRARLLSASDWVVTRATEQSEPVPEDWLVYRQALRDVSEQAGFPDAIEWPAAPT